MTSIHLFKWVPLLVLVTSILGVEKVSALDVSVLGGVDYSLPSLTALNSGVPTTTSAAFGGGLGLGYEFNSDLALELDAIYMPRNYQPQGNLMMTEYRLHLPVFLRYTVVQPLHILAGLYYSQGLGNISLGDGSTESYELATRSRSDWGLIVGAGAIFPIASGMGVLLRAQYLLGIGNASTNPLVILNYRDFQGIVGFNFTIY